MSTIAVDQPWLLLPIRMISPLRMYQTTPVGVAQPGDPQRDLLDGADRLAGVDDVADAVLVLEDHEDAGEEVLDQALRAEAERHAADTGRRQQRPERDADRSP